VPAEPAAQIALKLPHLPESPGVYLFKDAAGVVLYVGKAKRLRSRVRSYFNADPLASAKTRVLVRQIADVETIVLPTEAHALILESNLIKEYKPRFNIALRDDKSYPYIKVTINEPFPRVYVTRRLVDDGGRYFGPYTDVGAMRRALNVVKRIFTVRSCRYDMPKEMPERACLDYHIGRCKAPCILLQTQEDYRAMIDEVLLYLDGRAAEVTRRVRARMDEASANMDFESAGELRDALRHLQKLEEPTVVVEVEGGDRDVLGYARDGEDAVVTMLRIRGGKLLAREHQFVENIQDEGDDVVLAAYLARTYIPLLEHARELLIPFEVADRELIEETLPRTQLWVPQRGPRRQLIELADQNARHLLEEQKTSTFEADERAVDPVYELQRELSLQSVPRAMICFDISTAQGTDTVASCVWFENGRPKRAEYRKYKIESVAGGAPDDFASMREVVTRYFTRRLEEQKPLPDLVVVDGGKGQLSSAREALEAVNLSRLPTISLAKRDEEIFMPGRSESLRLSKRSPALRMLQRMRDEAHRFAITYNRKRRSMRTVTSELLKIKGVGPEKRRALLNAFGSVQGVKDAGVEEIAKLPGFSAASAQRLLSALLPPGEEGAPIATLETAITNVANDHEARTDASTEVPADESLTDQG